MNGLDELEREVPRAFKVDGEIEYCLLEKCKIKTEEGKVIKRKGQIIEQALIGDTERHLEDLERRKVIRDSVSSWRNPIRAIRKPNGSIRLVSNLIALNEIVEKDEYGLTNIRDVARATQGSRFLTGLDLKDGFYSIEIEEQDKHKTAFEFNGRVYEWNSMVMGFKNSPQILQRIMDQIFRNLKGRGVAIYMDDIVIYGKTRKEHDELCREVLRRLESNNMKVNRSKIQYCREEVMLLGVTVNGKDIKPSEVKQNEALEFPVPRNVSEVRRFLGLSGWFRNFVEDYAGKTLAFTNSLKGNGNKWKWTEDMKQEFEKLKITCRV